MRHFEVSDGPVRWLDRVRILVAAVFLLWAGLSSGLRPMLDDWRSLAARGDEPDLVAREDRRYAPLVASLPAAGVIGYLPSDRWPATEEVRRFYLAQYALTPRIVVLGTGSEFVIVGPDVAVDGGDSLGASTRDPRLQGFKLFENLGNGIRVFRRFE